MNIKELEELGQMSKVYSENTARVWEHELNLLVAQLRKWPNLTATVDAPLFRLDTADQQKVAPHMLVMGLQTSNTETASDALRQYERIMRKRHVLEEEVVAITMRAIEKNIKFVLQRGFAYQSYYPIGYIRQFNDLDIVLATVDDFNRLFPELEQLGYFIARPVVLRYDGNRGSSATIAFNKHHSDLTEPVMLDVSIAAITISPITSWRLPDSAWETRQPLVINSVIVPILAPTYNLLSLFIEAFQRENLLLRDILDLDRLALQAIDVHFLKTSLKLLGLQHEADRFRRIARRSNLEHLLPLLDSLVPKPSALAERPRYLGRLIGHVIPVTAQNSWTRTVAAITYMGCIGTINKIEDRAPIASLFVYQHISARLVYRLGLPIYLFPVSDPSGTDISSISESGSAAVTEYMHLGTSCYFCRARPMISVEEILRTGN